MPKPPSWMGFADTLTQKRRDVRHVADELAALRTALANVKPGPGYLEETQLLRDKIRQFEMKLHQAQHELNLLNTGSQGRLL